MSAALALAALKLIQGGRAGNGKARLSVIRAVFIDGGPLLLVSAVAPSQPRSIPDDIAPILIDVVIHGFKP